MTRNTLIENAGESQSCMFSILRIIWTRTRRENAEKDMRVEGQVLEMDYEGEEGDRQKIGGRGTRQALAVAVVAEVGALPPRLCSKP